MEQYELEIELKIKQEKLTKLEKEIDEFAKEYKLWKKKYKTIDDLHNTVKNAIRWQHEKDGIIYGTIFGQIFGPRSRNVEVNELFKKRDSLLEEIDDIISKLPLYKDCEKQNKDKTTNNKKKQSNNDIPEMIKIFIDKGWAEETPVKGKYVLTDTPMVILEFYFHHYGNNTLTKKYFKDNFITMKHEPLEYNTVRKYFNDAIKNVISQKKTSEPLNELKKQKDELLE